MTEGNFDSGIDEEEIQTPNEDHTPDEDLTPDVDIKELLENKLWVWEFNDLPDEKQQEVARQLLELYSKDELPENVELSDYFIGVLEVLTGNDID